MVKKIYCHGKHGPCSFYMKAERVDDGWEVYVNDQKRFDVPCFRLRFSMTLPSDIPQEMCPAIWCFEMFDDARDHHDCRLAGKGIPDQVILEILQISGAKTVVSSSFRTPDGVDYTRPADYLTPRGAAVWNRIGATRDEELGRFVYSIET